jgi:hypothetical protein
MSCVLVVIALLMPRLVMMFIAVLADWFFTSYQTVLWPVLGFFFAPYTTLVYMAAMLNNMV